MYTKLRLFKIIILHYYINKTILLYYLRLLYCRIITLQLYIRNIFSRINTIYNVFIISFQDGFAPPEELEGDGLAPDDEEEY